MKDALRSFDTVGYSRLSFKPRPPIVECKVRAVLTACTMPQLHSSRGTDRGAFAAGVV